MILLSQSSNDARQLCDGAEIRWQRSVHDDPARLHPAGSLSDVGGVHLHLQPAQSCDRIYVEPPFKDVFKDP